MVNIRSKLVEKVLCLDVAAASPISQFGCVLWPNYYKQHQLSECTSGLIEQETLPSLLSTVGSRNGFKHDSQLNITYLRVMW